MIKKTRRMIFSWMKRKVLNSNDIDVTGLILRSFCDGFCYACTNTLASLKDDPEQLSDMRKSIKKELMEFSYGVLEKSHPECVAEDNLEKAMRSMEETIDQHINYYSKLK